MRLTDMVWTLVASLLSSPLLVSCEGMSLDQIQSLLATENIAAERYQGRDQLAHLTFEGETVTVGESFAPDSKAVSQLSGLKLYKFYRVKPGVSTNEMEHALQQSGGTPVARPEASLGGVVTVTLDERFGNGLSQQKFVADVKAYFRDLARLESTVLKRYGFPAEEQNAPPPDPAQSVFYLDSGDLMYLAKAWGWEMRGSYGGSSPGWICPLVIDHALYWTGENPSRNSPGFSLSVRVEATKDTTDGAQQDLGWGLVSNGGGRQVTIGRWVSLEGGRRLSDLQKEIADFAHHCEKLAKERGYTFAPDPNPQSSVRGEGRSA